jgi:lysophospholipase III
MIFFRQQSIPWKRKYIARMISLSGTYGGSADKLRIYAEGDAMEQFNISAAQLRPSEISMPALAFLLPFPIFWRNDEVLVSTKTRTYTQSQFKEFFDDLGYPTAFEYLKNNQRFINDFSAPNVEIRCVYGSGIDTVAKYVR